MSISLDSITFPSISGIDNNSARPDREGSKPTFSTINIGGGYSATGAIPLALIIIIIILIAYYILFASLGNNGTSSNVDSSNKTVELLLWAFFILLILLNGVSYFYGVDIIASIKHIFSPQPTIDIDITHKKTDDSLNLGTNDLARKQQVFHVSDNKYNYEDAKAICSAYDGRLATYNELNQAYNDGADWCGYGWSDNQLALFPTQEEKWNKLQKIDGHQHDCGRPGINGGYIKNPNVRFGVNCYGYKPDITNKEAEQMNNQQLYPKNKREILFDKKVDHWRSKLSDIMLSPFNSQNWSIV